MDWMTLWKDRWTGRHCGWIDGLDGIVDGQLDCIALWMVDGLVGTVDGQMDWMALWMVDGLDVMWMARWTGWHCGW